MGNVMDRNRDEGEPSTRDEGDDCMSSALFPSHPLGALGAPSPRHPRRQTPLHLPPSDRGSPASSGAGCSTIEAAPGSPPAFQGEYVHMDKMEEMMRMFQEAIEIKKTALEVRKP
jgi:hypothetical protein